MNEPIKVFISYSQDDEDHKNWVLNFATVLRSKGIDVILDAWDLTLGDDLRLFMEESIQKSDKIICICSEKYVEKANRMQGGAGYESMILSADMLKSCDLTRIIPVVVNNSTENKVPYFLSTKIYIDFTNKLMYDENMSKLIFKLYDQDKRMKPPLGLNPFSQERANSVDILNGIRKAMFQNAAIKGQVSFDYLKNSGHYTIGSGEFAFETMWTTCGENTIYAYNDYLKGIGYNKDFTDIQPIHNLDIFDFTSRSLELKINDILLLENKYGHFALLKITNIERDKNLSFEYQIMDTQIS